MKYFLLKLFLLLANIFASIAIVVSSFNFPNSYTLRIIAVSVFLFTALFNFFEFLSLKSIEEKILSRILSERNAKIAANTLLIKRIPAVIIWLGALQLCILNKFSIITVSIFIIYALTLIVIINISNKLWDKAFSENLEEL